MRRGKMGKIFIFRYIYLNVNHIPYTVFLFIGEKGGEGGFKFNLQFVSLQFLTGSETIEK